MVLKISLSIFGNEYLGSKIYGNSEIALMTSDGCIFASQVLYGSQCARFARCVFSEHSHSQQ